MDSDPSLSVRSWPSFSTGMWSDESVADDVNPIGPGAYNNDSTALPATSNDFALYEPYNYTDSIFDSFIGVNSNKRRISIQDRSSEYKILYRKLQQSQTKVFEEYSWTMRHMPHRDKLAQKPGKPLNPRIWSEPLFDGHSGCPAMLQ
ncbi:hypothetical protein PENNAL_c0137G06690 [Penicillium nalgiovense]|uniref:Uncharacterized protein n=1 Tax=Penicillium nalgiovense TaxID=60175 RepID=A0A1V6X2I9_PENNA|nr:hypothetical protein PENNAL_c0137G06690 [Penicillium nalgiovense]